MVIKRPTECLNACCGAICTAANYQFNKGIFGDNPKRCPDYRFYEAPSRSEKRDELLDKIRAEVLAMMPPLGEWMYGEGHVKEQTVCEVIACVVQIIDKYRKESKEEEDV